MLGVFSQCGREKTASEEKNSERGKTAGREKRRTSGADAGFFLGGGAPLTD